MNRKSFLLHLMNKDYTSLQEEIAASMNEKITVEIENRKLQIAAEECINDDVDDDDNITEARFKIVRARIRKGKVQRRKKVSTVKGYTFRGGRLKRMGIRERRKRKLGQRRGKLKRRAKLSRSLLKRKRSLRRRKGLGLR